ncbi:Uncharacterised protein [Streptococcus pneumoniae]|jgi:hypothetical protein|uniref:Uncharacterized protein n=3 Tax=Gammaproteobacteria TaxID=1236 RepID=A0A385FW38_PSEAI|nr:MULTISPECIES: hypothetical protein [Pseudomonadaceae]CJM40446.1 Uncharacterised protein [Streptococcus pneumoniae]AXV45864.1 hypothetical protein pMKPA34_0018 [Pseudomonas aeruginosa]MBA1265362.1 hypothetical protein [Stutzerimonas stutzeri]MBA1306039.1 hypothetical protein [Stutzerimonas stutzeri]MBH8796972.1 hypothetical protein [Pseudomonas aeruginosa]
MENVAVAPLLDLFGDEVIIQRRSLERRPRRKTVPIQVQVQLGFLDILEMSDAELELLRAEDEITDDYIDWMRSYMIKMTLRQILHPQVSIENWWDGMLWVLADEDEPFSFKTCCNAAGADHEEVRENFLSMMRRK